MAKTLIALLGGICISIVAFAEPHIVMVDNKPALSKKSTGIKGGLGGTEIDDMAREIMQQQQSAPASPSNISKKPLLQPLRPVTLSSAPMVHTPQTTTPQTTIRVEILQTGPLVQGQPLVVKFRLKAFRERRYLTMADLKEVHTKKIHVLMADQTLTDYQHLHPTPDPTDPEMFTYTITPHKLGAYRVWVDITLNDGTHEIIPSYIRGNARTDGVVDRQIVMTTQQGDIKATLKFEPVSLVLSEAAVGTLDITDGNGKPLHDLEPIMGAFGHIVAINEDRKTLAHVHPMGDEPTDPEQRGVSPLTFHLEPNAAGITKIFAQIRRGGSDYTLPFSVQVNQ